ncbi:MAG: hypothetical protein ACRET4_05055, partial [Steroidobacteraceae bacterium]
MYPSLATLTRLWHMPRLDRLPEIVRNSLLTFPVHVNDDAPFVRLGKPLWQCRLALLTTAGLHRREDRPFFVGDDSYRVIASDGDLSEIIQSHASIGFDRSAIMRDLNVTFPIERVRELVLRHELGSV